MTGAIRARPNEEGESGPATGHWPASQRLIRSFRTRIPPAKERSFFPSFGDSDARKNESRSWYTNEQPARPNQPVTAAVAAAAQRRRAEEAGSPLASQIWAAALAAS